MVWKANTWPLAHHWTANFSTSRMALHKARPKKKRPIVTMRLAVLLTSEELEVVTPSPCSSTESCEGPLKWVTMIASHVIQTCLEVVNNEDDRQRMMRIEVALRLTKRVQRKTAAYLGVQRRGWKVS